MAVTAQEINAIISALESPADPNKAGLSLFSRLTGAEQKQVLQQLTGDQRLALKREEISGKVRIKSAEFGAKRAMEREKEAFRIAKDNRIAQRKAMMTAENRLAEASKDFAETGNATRLRAARRAAVRLGVPQELAHSYVAEGTSKYRLKLAEEAKNKPSRRDIRIGRQKTILERAGLPETAKVPGGGEIGKSLGGKQKQFRGAFESALKRHKTMGGLKKAGIAGALAIPATMIAKSIFSKDEGPELPPEMQVQLAQALAGAQGGGDGGIGGLETSRTLNNMNKLIAMIKALQDMSGMMTTQPSLGRLV